MKKVNSFIKKYKMRISSYENIMLIFFALFISYILNISFYLEISDYNFKISLFLMFLTVIIFFYILKILSDYYINLINAFLIKKIIKRDIQYIFFPLSFITFIIWLILFSITTYYVKMDMVILGGINYSEIAINLNLLLLPIIFGFLLFLIVTFQISYLWKVKKINIFVSSEVSFVSILLFLLLLTIMVAILHMLFAGIFGFQTFLSFFWGL